MQNEIDYDYWLEQELWTKFEALCLLCNLNPKDSDIERDYDEGGARNSKVQYMRRIKKIDEQIERSLAVKSLTSDYKIFKESHINFKPITIIKWAINKKIVIPKPLTVWFENRIKKAKTSMKIKSSKRYPSLNTPEDVLRESSYIRPDADVEEDFNFACAIKMLEDERMRVEKIPLEHEDVRERKLKEIDNKLREMKAVRDGEEIPIEHENIREIKSKKIGKNLRSAENIQETPQKVIENQTIKKETSSPNKLMEKRCEEFKKLVDALEEAAKIKEFEFDRHNLMIPKSRLLDKLKTRTDCFKIKIDGFKKIWTKLKIYADCEVSSAAKDEKGKEILKNLLS